MQGSSLAAIQEGFQHAIRAVAGVSEALLLVSFSGHAVMSAEGKMMWAPEDADRKDMATHFPMSTLCRDLMEVHVDHVAQAKFHAPAAPNLFVVILADSCREAVTSSQIEPLRSETYGRRRRFRPSLYTIYACAPGGTAWDAVPNSVPGEHSHSHSPFMEQVVVQLRVDQRVPSFSDKVAFGLSQSTRRHQEVFHDCRGNFQGVTLHIPWRLRSGSGSSILTESRS